MQITFYRTSSRSRTSTISWHATISDYKPNTKSETLSVTCIRHNYVKMLIGYYCYFFVLETVLKNILALLLKLVKLLLLKLDSKKFLMVWSSLKVSLIKPLMMKCWTLETFLDRFEQSFDQGFTFNLPIQLSDVVGQQYTEKECILHFWSFPTLSHWIFTFKYSNQVT